MQGYVRGRGREQQSQIRRKERDMRQVGERETQEEKVSMGREQKTEKRPQERGSRGGVIHWYGYPHQRGCCVFSVILLRGFPRFVSESIQFVHSPTTDRLIDRQ